MQNVSVRTLVLSLAVAAGSWTANAWAQKQVELNFYYPVVVGGTVAKTIDQLAADFAAENPGIKVKPIFSGTYQDSLAKALAAHKKGEPPHLAVLQASDIFTLIDEDAIVPIDGLMAGAEDKRWMDGFFRSFMKNSRANGKTWAVPFQRSTIVMYWNKDMFKEAGLDPDRAPGNWQEMVDYAKKLTKADNSQWGLKIPSAGYPYWLFQGLVTATGAQLMNEAGTETYIDKPEVAEALQFWVDLGSKHKVMPSGVVDWASTPKDFLDKKVAMIWTTTGNLTNIRTNASFPFGVAPLPAKSHRGSPTGGANFYVFKKTPPEYQQAAFKFIKWATSPQRAAQWSIATGYVAVTTAAWDTAEMKRYLQEVPAANAARNQVQSAVAEFSTHENPKVTKALNDAIQSALSGAKPVPEALKEAQAEASGVLQRYR